MHKTLNRSEFLASVAGVSLAARLAGAAPRRPNILFILADDMGYGDCGCYGQQKIRTPNIDRLARDGTRFTDAYAGGVVCAPSRSVLMTGLHTGHTPIRANVGTVPLAAGDVTVAQVLHDAGYVTGGFGKWGLGEIHSTGVPSRHGFDEFFGYLHQVHAHSYFPDFLWDNEKRLDLGGKVYSADLIAERSFEFLRKNHDRPFFLYACSTLPHANFEIPSVAPYENEPWTKGQKTYAAMNTRLDSHVGKLLGLLREYDLERDTLVIFTSDNGAHSGDDKGFEFFRSNGPLRGEKGQLYEGGIREPMIARWPGRVPAGRTSAYPWAFCDVLPTLAEVASAKVPKGLDGISVLPVLEGRGEPRREYLYWESNAFDRASGKARPNQLGQAARIGNWKAIRKSPGAAIELYDLANDISESKDLAAANPQLVERARKIFAAAHTAPRLHSGGDMKFLTK